MVTPKKAASEHFAFGASSPGSQAFGSTARDQPALEPILQVVFKGLQKRDATTRARASDDLIEYIRAHIEQGDLEAHESLIRAFVPLYSSLATDVDRRVRSNAHTILGLLVATFQKKLAKDLPEIAPYWLLGRQDLDRQVSRAAADAFDSVFATETKRDDFQRVFKNATVSKCRELLFSENAESFSDLRFTNKDDAGARYSNVCRAALLVLAGTIDLESDGATEILSDRQLYKLLVNCDASVQAAGLSLVSVAMRSITADLFAATVKEQLSSLITHIHPSNTLTLLDILKQVSRLEPAALFISEEKSKKSLSSRLLKLIKGGPPPGTSVAYWSELRVILSTATLCSGCGDEVFSQLLSSYEESSKRLGRSHIDVARKEYAILCVEFVPHSESAKHKFMEIFTQPLSELGRLQGYSPSLLILSKLDNKAAKAVIGNLDTVIRDLMLSTREEDLLLLDSWTALLCDLRTDTHLQSLKLLYEDLRVATSITDSDSISYSFFSHAAQTLIDLQGDSRQDVISIVVETFRNKTSLALHNHRATAELIKGLDQGAFSEIIDEMLQILLDANAVNETNVILFVDDLCSLSIGQFAAVFSWIRAYIERCDPDQFRWDLLQRYIALCTSHAQLYNTLYLTMQRRASKQDVKAAQILDILARSTTRLPAIFDVTPEQAVQFCAALWPICREENHSVPAEQFFHAVKHAPTAFTSVFHDSCWQQVTLQDGQGIDLSLATVLVDPIIRHCENSDAIEKSLAFQVQAVLPRNLPGDLRILHPLGSLLDFVQELDVQSQSKMLYDAQGQSPLLRICRFVSSSTHKVSEIASLHLAIVRELLLARLQDASANLSYDDRFSADDAQRLESLIVSKLDCQQFTQNILRATGLTDRLVSLLSTGSPRSSLHFYEASALYRVLSSTQGDEFEKDLAEPIYISTTQDLFLRIASSTALSGVLWKTKNMALHRNRLVSDLSGRSSEEEALKSLTCLNALLGEEGEDLAIPRQRLMLLIKTQLDVAVNADLTTPRTYQTLSLLTRLLPEVRTEYGTFWKTGIEWLHQVLAKSIAPCPTDLSIQYVSMKLISWFSSHFEANDDLSEYWINLLPVTDALVSKTFISCADLPVTSQANTLCTLIAARLMRKIKINVMSSDDKNSIPAIVSSGTEHVQLTAYSIQCQIIEAEKEEMIMTAAMTKEYEEVTVELPEELLSIVLDCPIDEQDVYTASEWLPGPHRGYFMAWMLIFKFFEDTPLRMRMKLIGDLQKIDLIEPLLAIVFAILRLGEDRPADISSINKTETSLGEVEGKSEMLVFAARLYYQCLLHVPSLVRAWWIECKDRLLSSAVEQVTEKFYSMTLIQNDAQSLQSDQSKTLLKDDNLSVRVSNGGRDIFTTYEIDEQKMEMAIRLPSNYPLRRVAVEGLQRIGVKDAQWRAWLLASQAVLTAQNGSILDAISLFQRNVSLHFEGVADCNICFSVLSVQDKSLPSKKCQTCKNLFHSSCLFKWFKSSSQSRCPLCRTSFAF